MTTCPRCNAAIDAHGAFCQTCGLKFEAKPVSPPPAVTPTASTRQATSWLKTGCLVVLALGFVTAIGGFAIVSAMRPCPWGSIPEMVMSPGAVPQEFFPGAREPFGGSRTMVCQRNDGTLHGLTRIWYRSGALGVSMPYIEGRQHGTWQAWYENGQLSMEGEFQNGEPVGVHRTFYQDGKLAKEMSYANGEKDGLQTIWAPDGNKKSETHFSRGKRNGAETTWWPGAGKAFEGQYANDLREGEWRGWHSDGREMFTASYRNGRETRITTKEPDGSPGLDAEFHQNGKLKTIRFRGTPRTCSQEIYAVWQGTTFQASCGADGWGLTWQMETGRALQRKRNPSAVRSFLSYSEKAQPLSDSEAAALKAEALNRMTLADWSAVTNPRQLGPLNIEAGRDIVSPLSMVEGLPPKARISASVYTLGHNAAVTCKFELPRDVDTALLQQLVLRSSRLTIEKERGQMASDGSITPTDAIAAVAAISDLAGSPTCKEFEYYAWPTDGEPMHGDHGEDP